MIAVVAVIAAIKLASGMNGDSAHALTVPVPNQVLTRTAFAPIGHEVATLDRGGLLSWRSANDPGRVIRTVPLATLDVSSGVMSGDGSRIATVTSAGAVQVWDADSGRLDSTVQGGSYPAATVTLNSGGSTLAVQGTSPGASGPVARAWSVDQSRCCLLYTSPSPRDRS